MKINSLVSMGDVLPPRKQTVVERLKRRFGHYRQHQNACLPRYEQAANGLYETQRQDTLLLKQRYLESKAKKAKSKSDHHRTYKEPSLDSSKIQLHSKSLKRNAEDALSNATSEATINDDTEKPAKIQCTEPTPDKPPLQADLPLQQANQQQSALSSFSVQIVQQFTQSPINQSPQTIQTNVTVQALPKPLQSPVPQAPQNVSNAQDLPNAEDHLQTAAGSNIECKQEKDTGDSDLCQFKANQASNNSVSSCGDRLSDTFPSIEFTDESTVFVPDMLKHLIEDVFNNPADIMKDFNFEDSVGSLKDQEEATKEIIETLKRSSPAQIRPFHNDSLPFAANSDSVNQQNGLFKSISSSNDTPGSVITSTVSVTSSSPSYYNSAPQRLQSYNSSLPLPNALSMDFKLNEPSPAALTLKQLAEQHQNMQQKQQQLGNSTLNNRPQPFNQTNFSSQMNPLRPNYLNGSNHTTIQNNSPKMLNSSTNIFNSFDQHLNNFQNPAEASTNFPAANCDTTTMTQNNVFGADVRSRTSDAESEVRALQMKLAGQQQQKPPAYGTTRPLTHYAGNNVRHQSSPPVPGQHRPTGRQFQNNSDMRLQMSQVQQMQTQSRQHNSQQQLSPETHNIKQQQHTMMQQQQQPLSNMYANYPPQQPVGNPSFHSPMSQPMTYSPQFAPNPAMNRPPPEYKPSHRNDNLHIVEQLNAPSQVMFNQPPKNKYQKQQRAPNVTINPDGSAVSSSHDWRTNLMNNQQQQFRSGSFNPQENYGDLNANVPVSPNVPLSPIYNQFRMPGNQIPNNRRPNMVAPPNHMMQRQRLSLPQQQPMRNPSMDHPAMAISSNAMNAGGMMGPMYAESQDMDRQDGSHLSLDFLDNIESSASDLLNFDQVMQSGAHYPILDDILGK